MGPKAMGGERLRGVHRTQYGGGVHKIGLLDQLRDCTGYKKVRSCDIYMWQDSLQESRSRLFSFNSNQYTAQRRVVELPPTWLIKILKLYYF